MFAQGLVMKRAGIGSVGVVSLAALVLLPATGGAQEEPTAETMTELSEEAPTSTAGNERSAAFDGGTGLFFMPVANGVDAGIFLLSAHGEFFSGKDVIILGDEDRRFGGRISLSYGATDNVELTAGLGAHSNFNSATVAPAPTLIQSVGNLNFGAKYHQDLGDGLRLGAALGLGLPAAAADVGVDFGASAIDILGLATFDLREQELAPLRAHLLVGYTADGEESLFKTELTKIERFGHGVRGYDVARIGLGADLPLDSFTPSIEWALNLPVGAPCNKADFIPCVDDAGFSAYPSTLTIGVKAAPAEGVSLDLGAELGVTTKESQGTPAVPAWNIVFGASYALNPKPVIVERVVEVEVAAAPVAPAAAVLSYVSGTVVDAATKRPIGDVRIKYLETEFSDQVGSADGKFRSIEFVPGTKVTIQLSAPGYTNRSMRMTVAEAPVSGTIEMQQAIVGGRLAGRVTAEGAGAAEASVWLSGEEEKRAKVDPATGTFQIDVKPGDYRLVVSAPGHASVSENISILNGRQENSFQLRPLEAGQRLRLTGDAYEVDDADAQVSFDGDRLTADSRTILDQVVKLLQSDASLRFIVRAHTDEQSAAGKAVELTQKRAKAVITYLTSKGIEAGRLRGEGVGDAEPKFPNLSDRNRRRNNRVEFVLQTR
jgi:outer membrane protein OmpA-like peptidoglycan-associated protein